MITKNLKRKKGQLALIIKSKRIKENKMKEFTYTITDPEGIHARPAGELVKAAKAFESAIKLNKEGKSADCIWYHGTCCKAGTDCYRYRRGKR